MSFFENVMYIDGKPYDVRYLNKSESEFLDCVNEGYIVDDIIMIGYCDNPLWETIITWHEIGHVVLDTKDESKVWQWVLENAPVNIPVEIVSEIRGRMK